jgi:hypothetical protein
MHPVVELHRVQVQSANVLDHSGDVAIAFVARDEAVARAHQRVGQDIERGRRRPLDVLHVQPVAAERQRFELEQRVVGRDVDLRDDAVEVKDPRRSLCLTSYFDCDGLVRPERSL